MGQTSSKECQKHMAHSTIEWTERTWNPTTGCTKVSQGCKFCYAEAFTRRLQAMGVEKYADGFAVRKHPEVLHEPKSWRKSSVVFVNSMSDLLHEEIDEDYIHQVVQIMNECPQHTFQVLTKRPWRLIELPKSWTWNNNIWLGTSVESEDVQRRIDELRDAPTATRFMSLEPLLGLLPTLNLEGIQWVIVGGESGRKARPMKPEWVDEIQIQCKEAGVPFFFKQWGGTNKKAAGRLLHGRTYDEMPRLARDVAYS